MDICVFHIADIHIKNIRRDEYDDIFDKLISDISVIKDNNLYRICLIAGDIFDGKTSFSATNVLDFLKLIRGLCNVCDEVITIMGNHDINLNMENSTDLIYPIWKATSLENWKHIKTTESIIIKDICFNIQSPNEKINLLYGNAKYNILVIHENIGGVKFGDISLKGRVNIKDLEKYDAVMAGHIHEMTSIGNNGAYCGALIQQNQGETITKGYIKWIFSYENKEIKREFIPIVNKFGFLKIVIIGDKISTNTIEGYNTNIETPYKAVISVDNANKEVYDKQIQEIQEMYKIQPETKNLTNVKIETENINDSSEQIKLLTKMLENNAVPDNIKSDILYMHKTCEKEYYTKYNWEILKLEWANMFCYNTGNVIDFTQIHDNVIGIISKNKSGKSSVVDILIYALFNETLRGTRGDIINKYHKDAYLKVKFKVDNDIHEISRIFYGAGLNEILYTVNGENKTGKDVSAVYKMISSIIGTYDDFISTVVMTQDKKNDYISMSRNDQVDFLSKLLGLDILQNNLIFVREEKLKCKEKLLVIPNNMKKEDVQKELLEVKSQINTLKNDMCNIEEFIVNNQVQLIIPKIKSIDVKKEIDNINHELTQYTISDSVEEEYIALCKTSIPKPTELDVEMAKEHMISLDENLNDYREHKHCSIEKIKEKLQKLQHYCSEVSNISYQEVNNTRKNIKKEIQTVKNNIKIIQEEIKKLESFIINNVIILEPKIKIDNISEEIILVEKQLADLGEIPESAEEEYIMLCKINPPEPTEYEVELSKEYIPDNFIFDKNLEDFNQYGKISNAKLVEKIKKNKKYKNDMELISYMDLKKQKDRIKTIQKELDNHKSKYQPKFIKYYGYIDPDLLESIKTSLNAFNIIETIPKQYIVRPINEIRYDLEQLGDLTEINNLIEKNNSYKIGKYIKDQMVFNPECEKCCINKGLTHNSASEDIADVELCINKRSKILKIQEELRLAEENERIDIKINKLKKEITIDLPFQELKFISDNINDISDEHKESINIKKLENVINTEKNTYKRLKFQLYLKLQQLYQQNKYKTIEICIEKVAFYNIHMKMLNNAENKLKTLKQARILKENIIKLKELLSTAINEWNEYNKHIPIINQINKNKEDIKDMTLKIEHFEEYIIDLSEKYNKYKKYLYERLHMIYIQDKSRDILHCINKIKKYNEHMDKISIFENKLNLLKKKRILLDTLKNKTIIYDNAIKEEFEYNTNLPIYEKRENMQKNMRNIADKLIELNSNEFRLQNLLNNIVSNEITNNRLKTLSEYEKCLNYKTGIPIQILQKASINITNYTNNIIQSLSDFSIRFKLEGTKLNLYINENGKDIPVELGSGFQKFIISLAMRQAFVQLTNKSMPKLLIIDEGFGCLDDDNLNKMVELIPSLKTMFKHIIIISHLDIIKNSIEFPLIIKQIGTKDKPCSLIEYGEYTIKTKENIRSEKIRQKKKPTILEDNIIICKDTNVFYCNICETEYKNKNKMRHIKSKTHNNNLIKYDIIKKQ